MGPTLDFDTKQRNSFLIKFGNFYNKNKILTILFIVNYEKITLNRNTPTSFYTAQGAKVTITNFLQNYLSYFF